MFVSLFSSSCFSFLFFFLFSFFFFLCSSSLLFFVDFVAVNRSRKKKKKKIVSYEMCTANTFAFAPNGLIYRFNTITRIHRNAYKKHIHTRTDRADTDKQLGRTVNIQMHNWALGTHSSATSTTIVGTYYTNYVHLLIHTHTHTHTREIYTLYAVSMFMRFILITLQFALSIYTNSMKMHYNNDNNDDGGENPNC